MFNGLFELSEATAARRRMYFHCVDVTDGMTPETGEAAGQPQISKNGAAWGNTTATLTAIGNGRYYVELTAAELDTVGSILGRYKSANTAEAIAQGQVVAFDPYDVVRLGLTALPNAAAEAAGGLFTRGTGAGQINQAANGMVDTNPVRLNNVAQSLLDLKDFADDGYDPATNKVQGVVLTDTVTTYTGNTPQTGDAFARLGAPAGASVSADIAAIEAQTDDIGAAGAGLTAVPWNAAWDAEVQSEVADALAVYDPPTKAELDTAVAPLALEATLALVKAKTDLLSAASGTSDSGTTTTMVDAARTEADTDYWKGNFILFTSGNIAGQMRLITAFTPGTDTITFAPATTQAVGTHTYEIVPFSRVDVQLWLGTVVTALVSNLVPSYIGGMAANTLNASALATDAVTEIQAGLSTLDAAGVRTAVGLASANLDAQLSTIDDFLDTEVAAIKAKTDNLPSDPADQSLIIAATDAIVALLGTPAGASLAADIAAIEAQTDDIGVAGAGLTAVPWNAAWDAEVESEVNDALNTAIAELSQTAPSATPTLRTAVMLLYMALRNKLETDATGKRIYNDAGVCIAKKTLSDDGSIYLESEAVSGP